MNWEAIAKQGYEVFHSNMRLSGVRVGGWEGLTVAERVALIAQAQEIFRVCANTGIVRGNVSQ